MTRSVGIAVALLLAGVLIGGLCRADGEGDITYLLSVSFSVPMLDEWTVETVKQFNATPYHGIAARIHSGYAKTAAPTTEKFSSAVHAIRSTVAPDKEVLPWVFLDAIVAFNPAQSHRNAPKSARNIALKGIDLDDKAGLLSEFYKTWRTALKLAKGLSASGIVLDPEAYSDYGAYSINYLSAASGKTKDEVRECLSQIGARLADITKEEFPDAIIWSVFTRFELGSPGYMTIPCIFDGMLRRAIERNIPLKLVDGGETVGYAFIDLDDLKRRHDLRMMKVARYLKQYRGHLVMGCTIAPWADAAERIAWMTEGSSYKKSKLKTIRDFEPLFVELMRRYRYFWIYGAGAAPYRPLDPDNAQRYNPVIAAALEKARNLGAIPPPALVKLDNLKKARSFGKDLTAEPERWKVSGGPEASVEPLKRAEGGIGIRFRVNVDKERGQNEKYPAGWLFLNRDLGDVEKPAGILGLRFEMRFHADGWIRVGIRPKTGGGRVWVTIYPDNIGEWQKVEIPIEFFALDDIANAARLTFYVAEQWYGDDEKLVFDFRRMYFCVK